jgi:predicted ester cyclase
LKTKKSGDQKPLKKTGRNRKAIRVGHKLKRKGNKMKTKYLFSLLVVGLIILTSCDNKSAKLPVSEDKDYTATEKANIENVIKAYELFSAHDTTMFDLFAEDIEKQDPEPIVGRKALSEFNKAFWKGFTDIQVDLDLNRISASGDYTFASGHIRGTNDGEFPPMGLSKTGKKIDVDFVEVIKWKNGKAVLSIPIINEEKLMQQLGLAH